MRCFYPSCVKILELKRRNKKVGDNLFHLEGVDEMNVMSVTLHFSGFRDHDSDVETRCCKWIIKFN